MHGVENPVKNVPYISSAALVRLSLGSSLYAWCKYFLITVKRGGSGENRFWIVGEKTH